jgi:hypothetical protein
MDLRHKLVWLRLSEEGGRALAGLVPEKPSFEAHVLDNDDVGVWVVLGPTAGGEYQPTVPVMLVKWDYISSINFDRPIGSEPGGTDAEVDWGGTPL